jgi:hypothetical protein
MKVTSYKPELDKFFKELNSVKICHPRGIEISTYSWNEFKNMLMKYPQITKDYCESFIYIRELFKMTYKEGEESWNPPYWWYESPDGKIKEWRGYWWDTNNEFQKERSKLFNFLKRYVDGEIKHIGTKKRAKKKQKKDKKKELEKYPVFYPQITFKTPDESLTIKTHSWISEIMNVLIADFNPDKYKFKSGGAGKKMGMHQIVPLLKELNEFLLKFIDEKRRNFITDFLINCEIWESGIDSKDVDYWLRIEYSPDIDVRIY